MFQKEIIENLQDKWMTLKVSIGVINGYKIKNSGKCIESLVSEIMLKIIIS